FRDWSPLEGHSITCLQFSPSGDRFGLATPAARFQVYDREGKKLVTTIKGDQYLADMAHTKGHVAAVTGLAWHPTAPDFIISASEDGTMRFWNLNGRKIFDELLCGDIIKVKNSRGLKACVTCMLLTPDGRALIAGVDDGSLQMFNLRAPGAKYIRPDVHIAAAHAPGSRIVSLSCDAAGTRLVSRSDDGVVKLWDARKPGKTPLATVQGADNHALVTNAVFSPDARLLLVPTARMPGPHASSGAAVGRVLVFRVPDLEAACQSAAAVGSSSAVDAAAAPFAISLPPGVTPTVVVWHAVINQVAVGCSDGATRILFDPVLSKKGAILSSGRAPKAREAIDEVLQGKVGRII
ncbi:WD40 repeat domain-containing protein, partial [archaeon]